MSTLTLLHPGDTRPTFLGVDIGIYADFSALVGCAWAFDLFDLRLTSSVPDDVRQRLVDDFCMREDGVFAIGMTRELAIQYGDSVLPSVPVEPVPADVVDVTYCKVWEPDRGSRTERPTIDPALITSEILRLRDLANIHSVYYDPWQFHRESLALAQKGITMVEFPQGPRRVESDSALRVRIVQGRLRHAGLTSSDIYNGPALTAAVTWARSKETQRGLRIVKGKAKVDAAVALSMAVWGAVQSGRARPPLEGVQTTIEFKPWELRDVRRGRRLGHSRRRR